MIAHTLKTRQNRMGSRLLEDWADNDCTPTVIKAGRREVAEEVDCSFGNGKPRKDLPVKAQCTYMSPLSVFFAPGHVTA